MSGSLFRQRQLYLQQHFLLKLYNNICRLFTDHPHPVPVLRLFRFTKRAGSVFIWQLVRTACPASVRICFSAGIGICTRYSPAALSGDVPEFPTSASSALYSSAVSLCIRLKRSDKFSCRIFARTLRYIRHAESSDSRFRRRLISAVVPRKAPPHFQSHEILYDRLIIACVRHYLFYSPFYSYLKLNNPFRRIADVTASRPDKIKAAEIAAQFCGFAEFNFTRQTQ